MRTLSCLQTSLNGSETFSEHVLNSHTLNLTYPARLAFFIIVTHNYSHYFPPYWLCNPFTVILLQPKRDYWLAWKTRRGHQCSIAVILLWMMGKAVSGHCLSKTANWCQENANPTAPHCSCNRLAYSLFVFYWISVTKTLRKLSGHILQSKISIYYSFLYPVLCHFTKFCWPN